MSRKLLRKAASGPTAPALATLEGRCAPRKRRLSSARPLRWWVVRASSMMRPPRPCSAKPRVGAPVCRRNYVAAAPPQRRIMAHIMRSFTPSPGPRRRGPRLGVHTLGLPGASPRWVSSGPFRVTSRHPGRSGSRLDIRQSNEWRMNLVSTWAQQSKPAICYIAASRPPPAAENRKRASAELGAGGGRAGLRRACIWLRISVYSASKFRT